jgi:DNA primase
MNLAEKIKKSLSPMKYYMAVLQFIKTTYSKNGWITTHCQFHEDKVASLRINTKSGGFCCLSCGAKGGDIIDFEKKLHGLNFKNACEKIISDWSL